MSNHRQGPIGPAHPRQGGPTRDLDNNENVKRFVKLPSWFTIDTPICSYNPDWAFATESEEKLYFVPETKGTLLVPPCSGSRTALPQVGV